MTLAIDKFPAGGTYRTARIASALFALALLLFASAARAADKPAHTAAKSPSKVIKKEIKTLRFCIYGDTRDGHDAHRKVIALMIKQEPEFVLQSGDLVHNGGNLGQWKIYDDITTPARQKFPFYIVRGNHDFGGKNFEERMTAPTTSGTKFWYSFDRANCHFIGLAVDEETPYTPDSPQYKWLVKDLESTRRPSPHIFSSSSMLRPTPSARTAATWTCAKISARSSPSTACGPSSTGTTTTTITPCGTASTTLCRAAAALPCTRRTQAKGRFRATNTKASTTSSSAK